MVFGLRLAHFRSRCGEAAGGRALAGAGYILSKPGHHVGRLPFYGQGRRGGCICTGRLPRKVGVPRTGFACPPGLRAAKAKATSDSLWRGTPTPGSVIALAPASGRWTRLICAGANELSSAARRIGGGLLYLTRPRLKSTPAE